MGLELATRTAPTLRAEQLIRDPHLFKWYAVALLAFVIYAYANEVERGRWDIIAAGLAVWFADWFNEIVNALVGLGRGLWLSKSEAYSSKILVYNYSRGQPETTNNFGHHRSPFFYYRN